MLTDCIYLEKMDREVCQLLKIVGSWQLELWRCMFMEMRNDCYRLLRGDRVDGLEAASVLKKSEETARLGGESFT